MGVINRIKKLICLDKDLQSKYNACLFQMRANQMTDYALYSKEIGISDKKYADADIIVSLTTYKKRLYDVYLAIESIMQQSMKPNRIVLWLETELQGKTLPRLLQLQQLRGLEIRYCEDLRSYKKLIPSLKEFPNSAIITIDDDLIYAVDTIERLVTAYRDNPSFIYCCRMHRIRLNKNGSIKKYLDWEWESSSLDLSSLNFPTTGAGTLFPPHCFNKEVFNENVFLSSCKYADDVWFKAMSLYNGVQCKKIFTHNNNGVDYLENPSFQDTSLASINVAKNVNDIQIKAVFDRYDLYKRLV